MDYFCCRCGLGLVAHRMQISYLWQVECVGCETLTTVRADSGEEAMSKAGLSGNDMNLDWYRRVRTRINGQTA